MANPAAGDTLTFAQPVVPAGDVSGFGFHETPRGLPSHWVVIAKGVMKNHQSAVPTTWNTAPRSEDEPLGPHESSLLGTALADPELPLELRRIRSFLPALAACVLAEPTGGAPRTGVRPDRPDPTRDQAAVPHDGAASTRGT